MIKILIKFYRSGLSTSWRRGYKLHRIDGPAVNRSSTVQLWFKEGVFVKQELK